MENNKKIKKFGWKEILLAAVLALIILIFVIVFAGNKATVNFVSVGGHFDEGEAPTVYDYENYIEGVNDLNPDLKHYHQIVTKTFRISAVATLPEASREGYDFQGWYLATIDENKVINYTDIEFTSESVKNLEKDSTVSVYAKWTPSVANKDISTKDSVLAALDITWKGMLGIFIVVGLIFVCIVVLNTVTTDKGKNLIKKLFKKKDNNESEQE